jgi:arsenite methyltransferase
VRRVVTERLARRRDAVLDRAALAPGETLLDVGCGEGLIAFGALERGAGTVVFSDVSEDLLSFCRDAAGDLGVSDRCLFVRAAADDLSPIEDESVDVATTRSVLIYVRDKAAAFAELHRVLRPGGRISLYEPINRYGLDDFFGFDLSPAGEAGRKIEALYRGLQPPESDPMVDFDERDLVRLCEQAGFYPIDLRLDLEIGPADPVGWEAFVNTAGNPNIPTLAEAMDQVLDTAERERLVAYLRPLVEASAGTRRLGHALLAASKPLAPRAAAF